MADCSVVFADPTTGWRLLTFSPGALGGGKCISLAEVAALAAPGRTLVIYHHRTRRKGGGDVAKLAHRADGLRAQGFPTVDASRSRPFSARAFFILDARAPLRARARQFASRWSRHLSWHEDVSSPVDQSGYH